MAEDSCRIGDGKEFRLRGKKGIGCELINGYGKGRVETKEAHSS